MLLFIIPFIIVTQLSNGSMLHIFANISPNISFGKYISPVKHTNCTTILDIPDDAFSVNVLPINIPIAINNTAIIIEIKVKDYYDKGVGEKVETVIINYIKDEVNYKSDDVYICNVDFIHDLRYIE